MKLIILGAGEGTRLRPLTNNCPKCMIKFIGKSLLEHQITTARNCGIDKIIVVKGFLGNTIQIPNIRYYENRNYNSTNMVETLFCAEKELNEPVIISYGDIIYEKNVLQKLIDSTYDFSVVIDKNWKEYWNIRFSDILDDVESLRLNHGYITNIGQKVNSLTEIQGQYIGLMKFQNNALSVLKTFYHDSKKQSASGINPLNPKVPFVKSYMTDLLHGLINYSQKIKAIEVNGGWLEFDTLHDFEIYNEMHEKNKLKKFLDLERLN